MGVCSNKALTTAAQVAAAAGKGLKRVFQQCRLDQAEKEREREKVNLLSSSDALVRH